MAVIKAFAQDAVDRAEPLTVAAACRHCRDTALAESAIGAIGLEIESHLVDLDHVADPVPWKRVEAIAAVVGRVAPGTAVTVEPGGQIELSGPPEAGVGPAVARLRYEGAGARLALADRRLGLAFAGADPARPSRRVNPRPRYRAMEQHFAATGRAPAGRVMMNSTAALQVNLQAGPRGEWPARVARAYRLGPTLVAIAASSPWLHGRDTGWKSVRQRAWSGLDARTCGPVPGCAPQDGRDEALDPASAWARFAMRAPVTFVRAGDDVLAVGCSVPFSRWASGAVKLGNRPPTAADLETHLSTLFPPVRLARLPGSALPGRVRATVVAGDRGGHRHPDGRPGRGRPRDRGGRADGAVVDRGGQGRARQRHAGHVRAPLSGDRRRPCSGRAQAGRGRPR